MSILRKRRKKSHLIREIHETKARKSTDRIRALNCGNRDNSSGDYIKEYEEGLRKFKFTVVISTILLLFLWWLPLLGPMLAGYMGGRFAGRRWLALKVLAIPVIFIAIIVNLLQFGFVPRADIGNSIGSFFLSYFPGVYYAIAPGIIPVISAFTLFHGTLGVGSNGYLIITMIMGYIGGMVSERRTPATNGTAVKKGTPSRAKGSLGGGKDGETDNDRTGERFLYRKRESDRNGFNSVADRIRKITTHQRATPNRYTADTDISAGKERQGWMRKEKTETVGARDMDNDIGWDGTTRERPVGPSVARYVSRPTAELHYPGRSVERGRRTITGGSIQPRRGKVSSILPCDAGEAPDGIDTVRRTPYSSRPPMSRAIIDRAVKSYKPGFREKKNTSGEPDCQMGHSYRQRNFESL